MASVTVMVARSGGGGGEGDRRSPPQSRARTLLLPGGGPCMCGFQPTAACALAHDLSVPVIPTQPHVTLHRSSPHSWFAADAAPACSHSRPPCWVVQTPPAHKLAKQITAWPGRLTCAALDMRTAPWRSARSPPPSDNAPALMHDPGLSSTVRLARCPQPRWRSRCSYSACIAHTHRPPRSASHDRAMHPHCHAAHPAARSGSLVAVLQPQRTSPCQGHCAESRPMHNLP
jgi:hypothetical protein